MEVGREVGGCRAEGLAAKGDGGKAAKSLTPDTDGTHVRIFQSSSQLEGSYVSNLLFRYHKQSGTKWGKEAPYIEKLNASLLDRIQN